MKERTNVAQLPFRSLVAVGLLLSLAACFGDSNGGGDTTAPPVSTTPTTPTPTPTPTTPTPAPTIAQQISAAFAAIFGQGPDTEGKDPVESDLPAVNFDREPIDF